MILPCLYNAPLAYYALILQDQGPLLIEQHDHYSKQTYRNRCSILGANGQMDLVIPVARDHGIKTKMKDVRIDNEEPWRAIHWKSIHSAYASSPFFEFLADSFELFYRKKYNFLLEFNLSLIRETLKQLNISRDLRLTEDYEPIEMDHDPREAIHPKRTFSLYLADYNPQEYHQVFSDRYGFVGELSILDLLFNQGQHAAGILRNSISIKK